MSDVKSAAVYVRISDDKAEDAAGVGRQEKDCRALAKRLGWAIGEVYTENDTSAYKRKTVQLPDGSTGLRVVRPAFRQLLDDLGAGVRDAMIGYDLDRLARDPRDLEDLIDVVESRRCPTRAVTGSLDLSNDSGVTMARVMVAVANKSSRDTARRVTRKQQELAEQGKHKGGGIRSFGYARDGVTVVESEAQVLRQVAEWVLAGDSLRTVAARLTAARVPTVRGNAYDDGRPRPWNPRSVHAAVTKPRVAGLREYRGEIIGAAEWPAILDRETWEEVRVSLTGRAEGASNTLRHWLARVLVCGRCGSVLVGSTQAQGRGARYWCKPSEGGCGKIAIDATGSEVFVKRLILETIAKPKNLAGLRARQQGGGVDSLRKAAKDDEAQLRELASLWAKRDITTKEYMAARGEIEKRLKGLQASLKRSMPGAVRTLLEAKDIPRAFEKLPPSGKRDVAQAVFPSGIKVMPSEGSRFAGVDPARLHPVDWAKA